MDTDLVILAQHGDKGAFGLIAAWIADRFLAVSRRILRVIDLAEDATQQALLAIWQDLPALRDPARFDAWSYRLLVRACYAEGRKERRWAPNLRLMPADDLAADDTLSSVLDRDQLERGFRRLSIDHRAVVVLYHYLDMPLDGIAELIDASRRDPIGPFSAYWLMPTGGAPMMRPELKILLLALALMFAACSQPVTNPPGGGAQPSGGGAQPPGAAPVTAAPPGY